MITDSYSDEDFPLKCCAMMMDNDFDGVCLFERCSTIMDNDSDGGYPLEYLPRESPYVAREDQACTRRVLAEKEKQ